MIARCKRLCGFVGRHRGLYELSLSINIIVGVQCMVVNGVWSIAIISNLVGVFFLNSTSMKENGAPMLL